MIGSTLDGGNEIVIVITERGGARQHRHLPHIGENRQRLDRPSERWPAVDFSLFATQRAARRDHLVHQDHPGTGSTRGERRRKTGGTTADHQHVAMRMTPFVAVRIRGAGTPAEPSGAANEPFIKPPSRRPHEGLVVEPGRKQR